MKKVLRKYVGSGIGINYNKPFKIEQATLLAVESDYFTIRDQKNYIRHFRYESVVQIIEHDGGVDISEFFSHSKHFTVIVKVGHVVEYVPA